MKKRRLLSIVLSLCMVLALMPQMVFADGPTGTPLTNDSVSAGTLSLTSGNSYYLSEDIEITETINISGHETVTLDLNGHVIKMTKNVSVIKVGTGNDLILMDSSEGKTGVITSDAASGPGFGGGVYVDEGSSFTMKGGTIYDCYAQSGGGVFVRNGGSFTMNNGAISGCNAHVLGGGVCVDEGGSFTMNGGIIYNCSSLDGGGVYNWGTLYANGGTIRDSVYNRKLIENATTDGCTVFYGGINIVNFGTIDGKKVTFKKDDNTYAVEIVKAGNKAAVPEAPTKEGYDFNGWYTDVELKTPYDFKSEVKDNITLYAGWDEKIITLTVPFTTTVKQAGNVEPPKNTTFYLEFVDYNGDFVDVGAEGVFEGVEVTASVETNGAGSYKGTMTITGPYKEMRAMLSEGAFVRQTDDGEEYWTYDDTVWGLFMNENANGNDDIVAMAVSEGPNADAASKYYPLIKPTIYEDGLYGMDINANPADEMTFTNTYTESASSPSDSEGTTNGDADNDSKSDSEDSAKTGDDANLALWLALMLLSGAGITGVTAYTRRKRTNE